jgi:hypothetical protein
MHWKNGMAQGFALFSHGAAAQAAISQIHNLVFDDGAVRFAPQPLSLLGLLDRAPLCLCHAFRHQKCTFLQLCIVTRSLVVSDVLHIRKLPELFPRLLSIACPGAALRNGAKEYVH